jgi:hypothetical protein
VFCLPAGHHDPLPVLQDFRQWISVGVALMASWPTTGTMDRAGYTRQQTDRVPTLLCPQHPFAPRHACFAPLSTPIGPEDHPEGLGCKSLASPPGRGHCFRSSCNSLTQSVLAGGPFCTSSDALISRTICRWLTCVVISPLSWLPLPSILSTSSLLFSASVCKIYRRTDTCKLQHWWVKRRAMVAHICHLCGVAMAATMPCVIGVGALARLLSPVLEVLHRLVHARLDLRQLVLG